MRIPRVSAAEAVHPESQSVARGSLLHLALSLLSLADGHPVFGREPLHGRHLCLLRRRRVELEGAVDDLDLVTVRERVQSLLEAPLPEVAPRAHDVGPNLDLHA